MLKNFNIIFLIICVFVCGGNSHSQEQVQYKDVILDGKPAKLNLVTGEVLLVNSTGYKQVDTTNLDTLNLKIDEKVLIEPKNLETAAVYHQVKEGETLLDISKLYGQPLIVLRKVNDLETTLIDEGQQLLVKNFENAVLDHKEEPIVQKANSEYHIVRSGETLYGLSKQYDVSINELKQNNQLSSNLITVGQKLKVSNFKTKDIGHNNSIWVVSKGDTLYSIAKNNNTTVKAIKQLNGLTSNLILVGQTLRLK
ncbi:MAG: LysM peptidoglycan-binding domain-containing protein [Winogradskyella sp.]|uniref:LysM peptidoglycan-binding domain-containing protein n=1 Tax=Winogradskyella sp. TaxID=1883156 RepID=UPI00179C263C|nr:LysM peptidoglycan-binding domain-containing protein [Winogradskyella sp.]